MRAFRKINVVRARDACTNVHVRFVAWTRYFHGPFSDSNSPRSNGKQLVSENEPFSSIREKIFTTIAAVTDYLIDFRVCLHEGD